MTILLQLLISALVTSPAPERVMLHTAQAQVARPVLPSENQILMAVDTLTVPMIDVGGRPAVALTLNGKGPYTFIVDTGANITVVDPALIDQLALPSLAGTPGVGPVRIAEVGIGSLKITNMSARTGRYWHGTASRICSHT